MPDGTPRVEEDKDGAFMDFVLRMSPVGGEEKQVFLNKFIEIARAGAAFIKHSWHGNPHQKTVSLDPLTGILSWGSGSLHLKNVIQIKPGKKLFNVDSRLVFTIEAADRTLDLQAKTEADRDFWVQGLREITSRITSRGSVATAPPSSGARRSLSLIAAADLGPTLDFLGDTVTGTFIKHGRHGKPHPKMLRVDPTTGIVDWGTGSLCLRDAEDVIPGKNTKVFSTVKLKVAHPSVCFSVALPNRTLDLQANSEEERDMWVKGLKDIMEHLAQASAGLCLLFVCVSDSLCCRLQSNTFTTEQSKDERRRLKIRFR